MMPIAGKRSRACAASCGPERPGITTSLTNTSMVSPFALEDSEGLEPVGSSADVVASAIEHAYREVSDQGLVFDDQHPTAAWR